MIWLYDIHTGRRATRLLRAPFISPTTFEQARGGALGVWEREAAGSGSQGAASSESAAGERSAPGLAGWPAERLQLAAAGC
jgi:hypothetical protein